MVFLPCIMGPTGAGKTAVSLALAEALPVSVINADSRQAYRDFPLITAQPSPEERALCPHRLYGFLGCEEKLGAGEYARLADKSIAEEREQGRLAVAVGGTGLYFRALLQGIAPIPDIPPDIAGRWQERCRAEGSETLHALLARSDPDYAARIHPRDRQRITRALEVLEATGRTFTWWHQRPLPPSPYRACKVGIGLDLARLEPLLARRIDLMLEAGALDEARAALRKCSDPAAPGWSGIGCAEIFQYLRGELDRESCRALWLRNTRAYAKRQLTWFRADREIRWFTPDQAPAVRDHVLRSMNIRSSTV